MKQKTIAVGLLCVLGLVGCTSQEHHRTTRVIHHLHSGEYTYESSNGFWWIYLGDGSPTTQSNAGTKSLWVRAATPPTKEQLEEEEEDAVTVIVDEDEEQAATESEAAEAPSDNTSSSDATSSDSSGGADSGGGDGGSSD